MRGSDLQKLDKDNFNPMMFAIPYGFNSYQNVSKPTVNIDFSILRQMSIYYPVARACIDRIKTQVTQLEWDISSIDENIDIESNKLKQIKTEFLKLFYSGFRNFLDKCVEDILVIDALSIYKQKTIGGQLYRLLPIDGSTIKLRVTKEGLTPEPPEIAYAQFIHNELTAEMTTDNLIYRIKNPRTNTPYGLSPMESLILTISSALQSQNYNLAYMTEGNDPEGFLTMPEDWSEDRILKFSQYWDAMLSGNLSARRKLKFIPGKSQYTSVRKPDDMSFEKFELWLLQQTCSCFGVPPQDIGFTYQVNRATAEVEQITGKERGLRPMINFLKEIFDEVLQFELGHTDLQFIWLNIDPQDLLAEAQRNEILIRTGQRSIDECRKEDGYDPLGIDHFVIGAGITMIKDLINPPEKEIDENNLSSEPQQQEKEMNMDEEDNQKDQMNEDIKRWQKVCLRCLKEDKPFKKFESSAIPVDIKETINARLEFVTKAEDIVFIFKQYLENKENIIEPLRQIYNELSKYK